MKPNTNWYVAATKPNGESIAAFNLEQQNFTTYVPRITVRQSHARRIEMVLRPLFPGYIFVHLDPAVARWRAINGTIGVRYILENDGRPQRIRPGFIDALKEREIEGLVTLPGAGYVPGQIVEVLDGPFTNHIGKILSADKAGRLRLLLELLGGEVVSTLSDHMVKKVG